MQFARLCISSTGGGGGKTLLSLALARFWHNCGISVRPFKKGPDYIDAAWLGAAASFPCANLDPFFLDSGQLLEIFCNAMREASAPAIGLIEGNRGLYDGLNEHGSCSTSALARALSCPVLLCVNSVKTTRTMAAILNGIINFEADLDICGVVLNKVGSPRHESALRKAIETNSSARILGAIPRLPTNPLPERHMGLASNGPGLAEHTEQTLTELAEIAHRYCDVDAIFALARKAVPLRCAPPTPAVPAIVTSRPKIGYILDNAFWFYYPENLKALTESGAQLLRLSLLDKTESTDWECLDGLYIGGGFPEDHAEALSQSPRLRTLAALAESGMPVYAECGGLILLCDKFRKCGRSWPMASVFDGEITWSERPCGLGYVEGQVIGKNPFFPQAMKLRGHEFHYSSWSSPDPRPDFQLALTRGNGLGNGRDGLLKNNVWASYTHIFAPAVPLWARNFVKAASSFSRGARITPA